MTELPVPPPAEEPATPLEPPAQPPVDPSPDHQPTDPTASFASPAPPPAPGAAAPLAAGDGSTPPPPPRLQPIPSGGVPRILVAVLAPILAIVMFAGGLAVGNSGALAPSPGGPSTASSSGGPQPSASLTPDQELALINQAWHDIQDNYVDAQHLDNQKLAYSAIQGIIDAVGDSGHTSFMTAAQSKAMDQSLSGTFVGIGIQVAPDDGKGGLLVGQVFPNTPAEAAGVKRGDRIVAVDGKSVTGQTQDQIIQSIRGPEGTQVTITLQRAGVANFDLTITRRKYDLPLASWTMIPGRKIAFVRLESFATGAGKGVENAIKAAESAGATAIVFDLRNNGGGYVNEAVAVASEFVGDGTVYQSVDRSGQNKAIPITPGGLATKIPLVVLANGNTASAAEIVSGCIQDAGRGQVVGEKTFGTGTVLGRFELADGSVLRIGTERWLTRNGRPIWHEGLDPNVTVALAANATPVTPNDVRSMTAAQLAGSGDAQLLKALDLLQGQG
ncbi:MAG TPA: S41 family peptidase [Candidatus Limnocylindrales bacterium]